MTAKALERRLKLAMEAFSDERVRWLVGKSKQLVESGVVDEATLDKIVCGLIEDEIAIHAILLELREKAPTTSEELAEATGLSIDKVDEYLRVLRFLGEISIVGEREGRSLYALSPIIEEERKRCPCETVIKFLLSTSKRDE